MSEQNPIFHQRPGGVSEDQLLRYLEGKMSVEEARAVEAALAEEGLESDAVEGLQAMEPAEVKRLGARLNQDLHRKIRSGKRVRRRGMDGRWAWVAVLIVLLAVAIGFAVIYLAKRGS